MSLEQKKAEIMFNNSLTTANDLIDAIYSMGFDVSSYREDIREICVDIVGMTCNSCVQTITTKISEHEGINQVNVSLANNNAIVRYNDILISPGEICVMIEDMGFDTALSSADVEPHAETALYNIEGMTCHSCVNSIQGAVGDLDGVLSIVVSLENKNATVVYRPDIISSDKIKTVIYDVGFDVFLLSDGTAENQNSSDSK